MYQYDFFIPHRNRLRRVSVNEILLIESSRNCCRVKTDSFHFAINQPLCKVEQLLPENEFCRIHRQFIIPFKRISFIEKNFVMLNDLEVPIGKKYQDHFLNQLQILQ